MLQDLSIIGLSLAFTFACWYLHHLNTWHNAKSKRDILRLFNHFPILDQLNINSSVFTSWGIGADQKSGRIFYVKDPDKMAMRVIEYLHNLDYHAWLHTDPTGMVTVTTTAIRSGPRDNPHHLGFLRDHRQHSRC